MSWTGCEQQHSPPVIAPQSHSLKSAMVEPSGVRVPDAPGAKPGETNSLWFSTCMIGKESGFDFVRYDDMHGLERIFEVNGGGAAVFDFDCDGWLDIYMTNGCRVPLSLQSRETPGKLFRNHRRMTFGDCSKESGLMQFGFCSGCAVGDMKEDGFEDLYIAAFGPNQLWINNGDGSFSPLTTKEIPDVSEWSSSVAFADLNADQALDLYVANYLAESDTHPKLCRDSKPGIGDTGCTPPHFTGLPDQILISDGAGGFIDGSTSAGLAEVPGKALGVAVSDFDRNGLPDIFLTHLLNESNTLYLNHSTADGLLFHDSTRMLGLGPASLDRVAFGVAAIDVDNNEWKDILIANGHTYDQTW